MNRKFYTLIIVNTFSADVTDVMVQQGYWPSYNTPYFPDIFILTGFQEQVNLYGPDYSYAGAPRAKIFKRDHVNVNDLDRAKAILRYNGWQWDPFSEGDPTNAISSRADLASPSERAAGGGIDSKITSYAMIRDMKAQAINGPTYYQQPIFTWDPLWSNVTHTGCPTIFNFDWHTL